MPHVLDIPPAQFAARLVAMGEKSFRAKQILEWVWRKGACDFEAMTNLSKALRDRLSGEAVVFTGRVVATSDSSDGTRKLLIEWRDGQRTETVGIPEADRLTVCVSTQVGCAMGCRFCASGLDGFIRNLSAGEICEQVLQIARLFGRPVTNVVFMGQGEPLANYGATVGAVRALVDPDRGHLSARRITVSTVGLPEAIRRLAAEDLPITLAISLHAARDDLREELIPTAGRHRLADILAAAGTFYAARHREVTLEYTLLAGVNDSSRDAADLAALSRQLRCNVNLIRYNPSPGLPYRRPSPAEIQQFAHDVRRGGANVSVRRSRGTDADAACGQLRRRLGEDAADGREGE